MVPSIGAHHQCRWKASICIYLPCLQSYGDVDCVKIIPCLMFVLLNKVINKIFGKVEVHLELPELEMESLTVHFTLKLKVRRGVTDGDKATS